MMAKATALLATLASLSTTSLSPVAAFAGVATQNLGKALATVGVSVRPNAQRRRRRPWPWRPLGATHAGEDPPSEDTREGMADAFAALDALSADDFDDLRPPSSAGAAESSGPLPGEEGVYDDILGDLSGDGPKAPNEDEGGAAELRQALDEVADDATTGNVSNDALTQDIQLSMSMEELVSSAVQEAAAGIAHDAEAPPMEMDPGRTVDIAKATGQLLEDEEFRKEIGDIFDRAGDKLRAELGVIKKEQEAFAREASLQSTEYLEAEQQRISEAEQSVARMIEKVASETDAVQRAMEDLELAQREARGEGDGRTIEDAALDLKEGGPAKQAALVGGLLLGSRAVAEALAVVGGPSGEQHVTPALAQAVAATACAAYFFLAK